MAIAAGVVLLALVGGFYFIQLVRLAGVQEDVQAQDAINNGLRTQIAELQDIAALEQEISATRQLLATLLQDRVLWSGIMRDISLVIPGEVWLNGLSGNVGGATVFEEGVAPPPVSGEGGLVGQISFTGFAFDHRQVALWLSRLEDVRGFINPWLSSSTKSEVGTTTVVQFSTSVDLSDQAFARRAGGTP